MKRDLLAVVVLIAVLLIALTNFFAQFIPGLNYKTDGSVTILFLGIAGTIIGGTGLGRYLNSKKDQDESNRD